MLLKNGSSGDDVKTLQQKLGIPVDGDFGPGTEAAVKKWQAANGLAADGIIGTLSWAKLTAAPAPVATDPHAAGQCICQTGMDKEFFKKAMNIKKDVLFTAPNMEKYPNTFNTPIETFLAELQKCFDKYGINNCKRKAHFVGQIWWETDRFATLEEYASGNYYNPGPGNHPDAARNGNTHVGDGPNYKGRGCIQLTWKNNYAVYQKFLNATGTAAGHDVVADPKSVTNNLFLALDSAGWFWQHGKILSNGKELDLNTVADALDTDRTSVLVNGGGNGKPERHAQITNLLTLFNAAKCVNVH